MEGSFSPLEGLETSRTQNFFMDDRNLRRPDAATIAPTHRIQFSAPLKPNCFSFSASPSESGSV